MKTLLILFFVAIQISLQSQSIYSVDKIKEFNDIILNEDYRYYELTFINTELINNKLYKKYESKGEVKSIVTVSDENIIVAIYTEVPALTGEGVAYVKDFQKSLGKNYIVQDGYKEWKGKNKLFKIKYDFDEREIKAYLANLAFKHTNSETNQSVKLTVMEAKKKLLPYFNNYFKHDVSKKNNELGYCSSGKLSFEIDLISVNKIEYIEDQGIITRMDYLLNQGIGIKGNYYYTYNYSHSQPASDCENNVAITNEIYNKNKDTEFISLFQKVGNTYEVMKIQKGKFFVGKKNSFLFENVNIFPLQP